MELFLVVLIATLGAISHVTGTYPPRSRGVDDTTYGRNMVRSTLNKEMANCQESARRLDNEVQTLRQKTSRARTRMSQSHKKMDSWSREVTRMRRVVRNLQSEKTNMHKEKQTALKISREADKRERSLAVDLSNAKKVAEETMNKALEMRRVAEQARAIATAAEQGESTDFIPQGFEQTRITFEGTPEQLAAEARRLEGLADTAMAAAKLHASNMMSMAKKATDAYMAAEHARESLTKMTNLYNDKCTAVVRAQSEYDDAVAKEESARRSYNTARTEVHSSQRNVQLKTDSAANYRAVYQTYRSVYHCADFDNRSKYRAPQVKTTPSRRTLPSRNRPSSQRYYSTRRNSGRPSYSPNYVRRSYSQKVRYGSSGSNESD